MKKTPIGSPGHDRTQFLRSPRALAIRRGEQAAILETARALFRKHGYAGTTVRAIAAAAGVDPAMAFYFFGTKQGLFGAALEMSAHVPLAIEAIFADGLDGVGERMIRTLVENLDNSDRTPLAMLTRSAPTHDRSEALLREFIDREITGQVATMLGTPDAALRAGMLAVQMRVRRGTGDAVRSDRAALSDRTDNTAVRPTWR